MALEAGRLGAWDWDIPAQQVTWSAVLERIHGLEEGTFGGDFEAYQRDIHPEDRAARSVDHHSHPRGAQRLLRQLPDHPPRRRDALAGGLREAALPSRGAPQRLVGVCVDITDRKKAEEQLRETLLALRDADQRKDQFLAMLAHELRNPLGPLLNATYLLGSRRARGGLGRRVRGTSSTGRSGTWLVCSTTCSTCRGFSRGKVELVRETVDTSGLTREVVDDHMESFRAAGLALELAVGAEPLFVHADRTRLAQVIGNLLSNALKFSERGQSVRVRVDRDASGGAHGAHGPRRRDGHRARASRPDVQAVRAGRHLARPPSRRPGSRIGPRRRPRHAPWRTRLRVVRRSGAGRGAPRGSAAARRGARGRGVA